MPNTKSISLHDKTVTLPLILSGPVLRRVTESEVTVWVAVHSACNVALQIKSTSTSATALFQGNASTVAVDTHLHIACITAEPSNAAQFLNSGTVYFYDLVFSGTGISGSLNKAGIAVVAGNDAAATTAFEKAFCYGTHKLPGFLLAPKGPDLSKLKIAHGSCRKPHGKGGDALRCLDQLLADNYTSLDNRPQMLCLTGDQIYADDVETEMLDLCKAVAKALLPSAIASTVADRQDYCDRIGFTSTEAGNHLLRFAEFVGMYLLIWSELLWPDDSDKLKAMFSSLRNFRAGLPAIRRVLANIPTYMIFDDHEISDDWFRTKKWFYNTHCDNFPAAPLGSNAATPARYEAHATIANGLLTYALFQGWGNLGAAAKLKSPFKEIINTTGNINSSTNLYKLRAMMMPGSAITSDNNNKWYYLHYNNGSSPWHFRVEFPYFRMVFLDTRTVRGFQRWKTPPALIFTSHLAAQLDTTTKPLTIVVSASPIFDIEMIEKNKLSEEKADENDNEAWGHNATGFLNIQLELAKSEKVVVLSGDVHYGFTNQVEFWDESTQKSAAILQCCASPLKNPPTVFQQVLLDICQATTGAEKAWVNNTQQTLIRQDKSDVKDKTKVRYQYRVRYLSDLQFLAALGGINSLNPQDLLHANGQIIFANHFGLLRFDQGTDTATHELYGPQPLYPSKHRLLARHNGVFKSPAFNDRPLK